MSREYTGPLDEDERAELNRLKLRAKTADLRPTWNEVNFMMEQMEWMGTQLLPDLDADDERRIATYMASRPGSWLRRFAVLVAKEIKQRRHVDV